MAIAPIDLQTLFTQLDKVGKTHLAQKEGQPLQAMMQAIESQRKDEELINQVKQTQDTGDGAEKVKDRAPDHENKQNDDTEKKEKGNEKNRDNEISVIRDPSLGNNIDISL